VDRRTIYDHIIEMGGKYHKYKAKTGVQLTPEHEAARRLWADINLLHPQTFWEHIWFQDECIVEIGHNGVIVWFWRHSGEQWIPDFIAPGAPKGIKVMISLLISTQGIVNIEFPELNPASPSGHGVTAQTLRANFKMQFPASCYAGGEDWIVMDNSSLHRSHETRVWFEEVGIRMLFLPPKSPNLNIIEHHWRLFKRRTHRLHPELKTMIGSDGEKAIALKAAFREAHAQLREERGDILYSGGLPEAFICCERCAWPCY
jgi:hypothetical protein